MDSIDKRNSVKEDYDLIADKYCKEFSNVIEDKDIINSFLGDLDYNSKIIDLGGGSGKITNYLINNNYDAVCYDFSSSMKKNAMRLFPNIPYILDDIVNIKNHFSNNSIDGIISLYCLFHIPKENMKKLFDDINNVLKDNGYFLATFQLGEGEDFVLEPYLNNNKKVLYMNYYSEEEIYELFKNSGFEIISSFHKKEIGNNVLGEDGNDAILVISKKVN